MADVFISYAKVNKVLAAELAKRLEEKGFTVWWDVKIRPGDIYQRVIEESIRGADNVIVLWTNESVASKWVLAEANVAENANKLIPVMANGFDANRIPPPFNLMHTAKFDNLADILDSLRTRQPVKPPDVSSPAPKAPIAAPSADDRLWDELSEENSVTAYQFYLGQFPEGAYAGIAKFRLSKLLGDEAPEFGEEPVPATPATEGELPSPGSGRKDWFRDDPIAPDMVVIPAGTFLSGAPTSWGWSEDLALPQRDITIRKKFAVGRFQVTFDEWLAFADEVEDRYRPDDNEWGRANRPVINVSWNDAVEYCAWLAEKTGKRYRLLSEAEWEYAARAGAETPFWWGDQINSDQANYDAGSTSDLGPSGTYRKKTMPVTEFEANPFGLYNVHGNVKEWVADDWSTGEEQLPNDETPWYAPSDAYLDRKVTRGGSWYHVASGTTVVSRERGNMELRNFNTGFRVARDID